jgi:hypothetical protein
MTESTEELTPNNSNNQSRRFYFDFRNDYVPCVLMSAVILLTVFVLQLQGRIWWCKWDSPVTFMVERRLEQT